MRAFLAKLKRVIDRNMATILAIGVVLVVMTRVPQIYSICFEMVPDLVLRPFVGGEWWLGVGFFVFVLCLGLGYTTAWFAAIP